MEIKLLRYLSTLPQYTIHQIANYLNVGHDHALDIIAKINMINPQQISHEDQRYYLNCPLDWLDSNIIKSILEKKQLSFTIYSFDNLPSTNSYTLNTLERLSPPSIIYCEWQNQGRGRLDRRWISKIGIDLTFSVYYLLADSFNIGLIPMLSAIAVNRVLKTYHIKNQIKWPNDIYHQGQKIGGILVENKARKGHNHCVIGIGLDNLWELPRNQLIADLVYSLHQIFKEFDIIGFDFLKEEWLDNCMHLQQMVAIINNDQEIAQGVHIGISEQGELMIKFTNGNIRTFPNGALSLKLLNS